MRGAIEKLSRVIRIESAILFGSWARGGGGEWSDIDLLIVSRDIGGTPVLERYRLAVEVRPPRVDIFIYTSDELRRMAIKGNPLVLSALVEEVPLILSKDTKDLMDYARRCYTRYGRMWVKHPTCL